MKIHHIHLKNINSLKGVHNVSLTEGPLAKTGLFAIIGPTGSGKSTLLDVITLALYNQTPRSGNLSKSVIEKNGAVITRNTSEAHCEVEYEANGKRYRSRWEISRARTGNLRDYEMFLYYQNHDGKYSSFDLKKSEIPAKNEELIGLNYAQFIKSILLSQGEFAQFLKAKPNERSVLLEKITGTEIYTRIGMAAFEKQKEEKQKLDNLHFQLGEVELLSQEEKVKIAEAVDALQKAVLAKKENLGEVVRKIQVKQQMGEKMEASRKAETRLTELKEKIESLKPDEEKLAMHNRLLPLKSWLDQLAAHQEKLPEIAALQKETEDEIENLKTRIEELKTDEEKLSDGLKEQSNTLEKMLPVFEQTKKVDGEIELQRSTVKQFEERLQQLADGGILHQKELSKFENDLNEINGKLLRIENFLTENPKLESLEGELLVIQNQKQTFDNKLTGTRQLLAGSYPSIAKAAGKDAAATQLKKLLDKHLNELESQKKHLEGFFEGPRPAGSKLQEKIEMLNQKSVLLTELLRLTGENDKNQQEAKKLKTAILSGESELKNLKHERTLLEQKIEITGKHIEELTARKDREALEARYDEARQQLKAGQPCPLCGSTEHPLVTHYSNTLNSTQKELTDQKVLSKKYQSELQAIIERITRITTENQAGEKNLQQLLQTIEKNTGEIRQLVGQTDEPETPIQPESIQEKLNSINGETLRLKQNRVHLEELSKVEESIQSLTALVEKATEVTEIETELKEKISPFLTMEETQKSIVGQIETLEKKLGHFKEAHKQKAAYNDKRIDATSKISEKKKQVIQLMEEKNLENDKLQSANKKLHDLMAMRKNLFGDKNPDREQSRLHEIMNKTEKELAAVSQSISVNTANSHSRQKELQKLSDSFHQTQTSITGLQTQLKPGLQAAGIEDYSQASAALLPHEEAETISMKINTVRDDIKKTEQTRDDLNLEIAKLFTLDDRETTVEKLKAEQQMLDNEISIGEQQKGKFTAQLEQDETNKIKSAGLLEKIKNQQKEFARWEGLNEMIGDAKGKKFSSFAQRLTLQQMLARANQHLKKLSNRYLLINRSISDEDELFVIDTYHGDETRSVKTLSGGESFLVSLALALGLSDLAGSKTRISSLFIDEGFGSLDQETLDTALSTLERLQYETNRTIGIISHVEALKERITTQIELSKDANGNSRIQIRS
jgi:exonuclease SbcC